MKKLLLLSLAALLPALASADAYDPVQTQRNATDTGYTQRILPAPAGGASAIVYYNGPAQQPDLLAIGSGLTITGGTLNAAAGQFNFSDPVSRTVAVSTAYQANDPTKASLVSITPVCTNAPTVVAASSCVLQARVGPFGLTCSNGTVVSTWTNSFALGLVLNNTSGTPGDIKLPIGRYFILCATSGTFSISAVDQTAG